MVAVSGPRPVPRLPWEFYAAILVRYPWWVTCRAFRNPRRVLAVVAAVVVVVLVAGMAVAGPSSTCRWRVERIQGTDKAAAICQRPAS